LFVSHFCWCAVFFLGAWGGGGGGGGGEKEEVEEERGERARGAAEKIA
jgi:hypothetical protein